jgi:hypothetical protein
MRGIGQVEPPPGARVLAGEQRGLEGASAATIAPSGRNGVAGRRGLRAKLA